MSIRSGGLELQRPEFFRARGRGPRTRAGEYCCNGVTARQVLRTLLREGMAVTDRRSRWDRRVFRGGGLVTGTSAE